jgi:hypothetical protein
VVTVVVADFGAFQHHCFGAGCNLCHALILPMGLPSVGAEIYLWVGLATPMNERLEW